MRCLLLILSLLLLNPDPIQAFETGSSSKFLVTQDATHYSITECALLEIAIEYLSKIFNVTSIPPMDAIQSGTCQGATIFDRLNLELDRLRIDKQRLAGAIEQICESNIRRDVVEVNQAATHFHNEEFDGGALLISQRLDATITNTQSKSYEDARDAFGALLHTVQDFYSHSNWIELGYREPNTAMGKYQHLGIYAWRGMHTCANCQNETCRDNILPSILEHVILTSGYYATQAQLQQQPPNIPFKPPGKCSHGGSNDATISMEASGGGINKDRSASDHGHLHRLAASVAYNSTLKMLRELWVNISDTAFGEFLGLATTLQNRSMGSLVVVMDDTGSMGPYISMSKQIATNLVNVAKELEYPPSNYILSPFNDPTWGPLTISRTPEQFLVELGKLYAHDGGDEPELFYHGIVEALKVCEVGSGIYAFTDAPAKDAYLKSQAIQLARDKQADIFLFYHRPSTRQIDNASKSSRVADVIEALDVLTGTDFLSMTGGVLMGINAQATNVTTELILQNLNSNQFATILLDRGLNLDTAFFVDPSIESLKIEITSINRLVPSHFRLMQPSGAMFVPTPVAQSPFLLLYSIPIQNDAHGRWRILSSMNIQHSIQIDGKSDARCSSTLKRDISGTSPGYSLISLSGEPVRNEDHLYVLTMCEKLPNTLKSGEINLIDANNGAVINKLTPVQVSATGFLSKISVPNQRFRIRTIVELENSTMIQRGSKTVITPTSISLTIDDQPYSVTYQDSISLNYTIFNHGSSPMSISLQVMDTLSLLSTNGFVKAYTISGSSNISDGIIMNTRNLAQSHANASVLTNTATFSISASGFQSDERAVIYIIRNNLTLTNQTDYQEPPTTPTTTTTTTTTESQTSSTTKLPIGNHSQKTVFSRMHILLCICICMMFFSV